MSGFSLSIKGKVNKELKEKKKKGDQKRQNVFGGENTSNKKTKIKLTHVDQYKEQTANTEALVIKPVGLPSNFFRGSKNEDDNDLDRTKSQYGLITNSKNDPNYDEDKSTSLNHISKPQNAELRWLDQLPEVPKEEEYEAVPVEEFGEALLRGMGWKGDREEETKDRTKIAKNRIPLPQENTRIQYAGIGAKKFPDRSNKLSNKRPADDVFLPLIKIDKQTGERVE